MIETCGQPSVKLSEWLEIARMCSNDDYVMYANQ